VTLLSICIPLREAEETLAASVRQMLASERTDFEILIADFTGGKTAELSRLADELKDTRLRMLLPQQDGSAGLTMTASACWNQMIPEARGDWISIIGASDYADPDIGEVISATVKRVPDADALAWGRARYVAPIHRNGVEIARIATGSNLTLPEQTDMMRKQFYWDGASDRPECHFGVWHGAVRRQLLERTREAFPGVYFEQSAPAIDSTCKTVMLARRMVFWERPLSVQSAGMNPTMSAPDKQDRPFADFPFSAENGPAAAAALAIEAFKRRYDIELGGWEDNFVKACAHDCETETSGERFQSRKAAYAKAITDWRGKRAMANFKPEFKRNPKLHRFQGLRDEYLYFNMAMDQTETAAEFYALINAMLFPVHLLNDKLA